MAHYEEQKRHRYWCEDSDARRLVIWLMQQHYWFEYNHVSSGDDPANEIICGVEPEMVRDETGLNVTQ